MNRLFVYAIIINLALIVGFVLLDYATWNNVALNLDPTIKRIVEPNGNMTEQITRIYSSYEIIQVGITVRVLLPFFMNQQDTSSISINLPFIWFILTVIVNLSLIWYLGIRDLKHRNL